MEVSVTFAGCCVKPVRGILGKLLGFGARLTWATLITPRHLLASGSWESAFTSLSSRGLVTKPGHNLANTEVLGTLQV